MITKVWCIYERFIEPDNSINLRKFYSFQFENKSLTKEEALHWLNDNENRLTEGIDYLILDTYTKEDSIGRIGI